MAIIVNNEALPVVDEILQQAMGDLLPKLLPMTAFSTSLGGAKLDVEYSQPVPVYRLTLDKALEDNPVQQATRVGWRCLIEADSGGIKAYADIIDDNAEPQFAAWVDNVYSRNLHESVHLADQVLADAGDYEIRVLEIPAIYTSTLWLSSEDNDVFIPFNDENIRSGREIGAEIHFIDDLVKRARIAKASMQPTQSPESGNYMSPG